MKLYEIDNRRYDIAWGFEVSSKPLDLRTLHDKADDLKQNPTKDDSKNVVERRENIRFEHFMSQKYSKSDRDSINKLRVGETHVMHHEESMMHWVTRTN